MRNSKVEENGMCKSQNCASMEVLSLCCEMSGYDIKPLNSTTGKGSYMLKAGQKKVPVPYASSKKDGVKNVTITLYKIKGLRGFLRRAAELRILQLKAAGKIAQGPCTPTANYPHKELLEQHLKLGYHAQGSCHPRCMVHRLYGGLDHPAAVKIFSPYIAKATVENLPVKVNTYLTEHIEELFGLESCLVYHNGDSALKTEVFNIINRANGLAVNNFMKHMSNGQFKFKVDFTLGSGGIQELLENLGFFLTTLFDVNSGRVQLGSDKTNGAGRVKIRILGIRATQRLAEFEPFIQSEVKLQSTLECGSLILEETTTEYLLEPAFLQYAYDTFNKWMESQ
ncbi:MAG: hypothetical protein ACTSRL_03205 [Candidatus Helarchaeota archaeon]